MHYKSTTTKRWEWSASRDKTHALTNGVFGRREIGKRANSVFGWKEMEKRKWAEREIGKRLESSLVWFKGQIGKRD